MKLKVISTIWLILCLCGKEMQVYQICKEYFEYFVTTNVEHLTPVVIEAPVTTVCFSTLNMIKWEKLTPETNRRIFSEYLEAINIDTGFSLNQSLSLNESLGSIDSMREFQTMTSEDEDVWLSSTVFENLQDSFGKTYSDNDSLDEFQFFNKIEGINGAVTADVQGENFTSYINITSFFNMNKKCFSIQLKENYRFMDYHRLLRQVPASGWIYGIVIENAMRVMNSRLFYTLCPNDQSLCPGRIHEFELGTALPVHTITYDEYQSVLLPPPFQSKCRDYRKEGLVSRGDCYQTCLTNKGVKEFGKIPVGVNLLQNETRDFQRTTDVYFNRTKGDELERIQEYCYQECKRQDCNSTRFIPRLLSSRDEKSYNSIDLLIPTHPVTKTTSRAAKTLVTFLTEIFSTLGFWMGLSIFGMVDKIVNYIHKARVTGRKVLKQKPCNDNKQHWVKTSEVTHVHQMTH